MAAAVSTTAAAPPAAVGDASGIAAYSRPHPLLLPEIVSKVMEYLEPDKRALVAAVRAHPTWAAQGLRFVWRHARDDALVRVAPSRRPLYAQHVEALTLSALHTFDAELDFPRLRHVTLLTNYRDAVTGDDADDSDSDNSNSSRISSDIDDSDDDSGMHRPVGAGTFRISDDRKAAQLDELCCWLPPGVTSISVAGDDDRVDAKLLCCFAQRADLAALVLRPAYLLPAEHMRAVLEAAAAANAAVPDMDAGDGAAAVSGADEQKAVVPPASRRLPPFANLRSFEGGVAADAVPLLAKALRQRATRLKLSVKNDSGSATSRSGTAVLAAVCSVHALTELHLFLRRFTLSNADIALLRNLAMLRVLTIADEPMRVFRSRYDFELANAAADSDADDGYGFQSLALVSQALVAPHFGNAELRALLCGAFGQQLRRFTWHVADALTPRAVCIVGECCPMLQRLVLRGSCDLLALADAAPSKSPVFAHLETLKIHSVEMPLVSATSWTRRDMFKDVVKSHLPKLRRICVAGYSSWNFRLQSWVSERGRKLRADPALSSPPSSVPSSPWTSESSSYDSMSSSLESSLSSSSSRDSSRFWRELEEDGLSEDELTSTSNSDSTDIDSDEGSMTDSGDGSETDSVDSTEN